MMNTKASATAATLTATLGFAAVCRRISIPMMHGMDMGVAIPLGSFASFIVMWVAVITILVFAQKILPAKGTIDVPLALMIVGLGILDLIAPRWLPASCHRCETLSVALPKSLL